MAMNGSFVTGLAMKVTTYQNGGTVAVTLIPFVVMIRLAAGECGMMRGLGRASQGCACATLGRSAIERTLHRRCEIGVAAHRREDEPHLFSIVR